jgi:phosphotransferase system  glucose/maltose/N-acetylglucosamine-specific IIC component
VEERKMTKPFLLVTAVVEILTGLVLLILPNGPLSLLLGIEQPAPEVNVLARWIGAALLAIGVASGMARDDAGGAARRGVVAAVLIYDVAAAMLFVYAAVGLRLGGPALWPAAVLHTVLAAWGVLCLTSNSME